MSNWNVIFDLGGVVLGWDPHLAYQQVMPAEAVADFLIKIDFSPWNVAHDAGQRFDDGEQQLRDRFPDLPDDHVRAYRTHFGHSLTGQIAGTGAVIAELQRAGVALSALTNWSDETFPVALDRFGILGRFSDILVSGAERVAKPDLAIFRLALERFGYAADETIFIDDSPRNVEAAAGVGMVGLHFTDADTLRADLVRLGVLTERVAVTEPGFHVAVRSDWEDALATGEYPWSSRKITYDAEGYVHLSFAHQTAGVLARHYADLDAQDLLVLEVDPALLPVPLIVEDLGFGQAYPHLYAPLPIAAVVAARPVA